MMITLASIVIFPGLLAASTLALREWQKAKNPDSEIVRKVLHVVMGSAALLIPWLFDSFWEVSVVGFICFIYLLTMRGSNRIGATVGKVLFGIKRKSYGDLCFVAGIVMVYWVANGDYLLYALPLLILTFADPAAAIVGKKVRLTFKRPYIGGKSLEGSIAFFFVAITLSLACFFVFRSDLLMPGTVLLFSLALSLVTTFVEAVSPRGWDNFFIPTVAALLLKFGGAAALSVASTILWTIIEPILWITMVRLPGMLPVG